MTVIELSRELGKAIQEDERYKAYNEAKEKNDKDVELQNMIGEFNILRMKLNQEMQNENKDSETMKQLDGDIKELYAKIMGNESMNLFNDAKEAMDSMLSSVNYIITAAANGEDPMTCPEEPPHSCSGSCSTCGGCH